MSVPQADAGPQLDGGAEDAAFEEPSPDAEADANADSSRELTLVERIENKLIGVWNQELGVFPAFQSEFRFRSDHLAVSDTRPGSGLWCRNQFTWSVVGADDEQRFAVRLTATEPTCGGAPVGDITDTFFLGQLSDSPLVFRGDTDLDETFTRCSTDPLAEDPCGSGNPLGVPWR